MCKGPVAGVWIKKRQVSLWWSREEEEDDA